MKYKNKRTGVIVKPSSEVAAQTFENSSDWVEVAPQPPATSNEKPLDKMTTAELTAKAAELGVDLSECKTNADRAAKIAVHLQEGGDA